MSAEAEIKQFIDRILRLKEEQDTLGEDIREVYAEAKGRGYDKTVLGNVVSHLRKVEKLGRDTINEREAIFDLYLTAYETGGRAHAPARTRENIEEFPADAQLVATVANAVQTKAGRITAVDIMIEGDEAEYIDPEMGEITNSLETANEMDGGAIAAVKDEVRLANADGVELSSSNPTSSGQLAFLIKDQPAKTMRDYRPHCQKPEACSASGLKHCYSCSKLLAVESEVE
jgi:uncharacterized protein (UPF0335 family)